MPSVLILGARAPVALDHARRFAHQGWTVFAADSIPCRITGASRAVTATVPIASPRYAPARFVADLADACRRHAIDLVLPTCEEVFYLSRYRDRLPREVRVVVDDFDKLAAVHSKWTFLDLATGCGAHVPDSAAVETLDEAREWARGRAVVMKPEFSRFGTHVRFFPEGIGADASRLAERGRWVVQEKLDGTELCSYSVAAAGRLTAHSLYRPGWRLSTSSSFHFEAAHDATIRAFVAAFAAKLAFTGQLSFDWIRCDDGRVGVLECNPRATSGCHLFALDDPLPAALAGTFATCIEPSSTASRMIAAVMLTAGLAGAVARGDSRRWRRDWRTAHDVIGIRDDRAPLGGAITDLLGYARIARARRCTLREAATADIEWDGQPLPDA